MRTTAEKETAFAARPAQRALADFFLDGQWHTAHEACSALGYKNAGTLTSNLRHLKASRLYTYTHKQLHGEHYYLLRRCSAGETTQLELKGLPQ